MSKKTKASPSTNSEPNSLREFLMRHTRRNDLWFIPLHEHVKDVFVDCTLPVSKEQWHMLASNVGKKVGKGVGHFGASYVVRQSDRAKIDEELVLFCGGHRRGISASVRNPAIGSAKGPPLRIRFHNVLRGDRAYDNDGESAWYLSSEVESVGTILFPEKSENSFHKNLYVKEVDGTITFALFGAGARVWTGLGLFGGGNLDEATKFWQSRNCFGGKWKTPQVDLSVQPNELLVHEKGLLSLKFHEPFRNSGKIRRFLDKKEHLYNKNEFGANAILLRCELKFNESFFRVSASSGANQSQPSLHAMRHNPARIPCAAEFVRYTGWRDEDQDTGPEWGYNSFSSMLRWEIQGFLDIAAG